MATKTFGPQAQEMPIISSMTAFGGFLDMSLLFLFSIVRNWDALLAFTSLYFNPTVVIDFAKVGAVLFTSLQMLRYFIAFKSPSTPSEDFPAKPMIFPCRTSHTRVFPKVHSFSYSYLWVGIPVGWKGSVGGMLSSDASKPYYPWYLRLWSLRPGSAWHTVDGDDYLERGHVGGGLQEKLHNYLHSQVCVLFFRMDLRP
jgi:hypothetical protein